MRINSFISLAMLLTLMVSCGRDVAVRKQETVPTPSPATTSFSEKSRISPLACKNIPDIASNTESHMPYTARIQHHVSGVAKHNMNLINHANPVKVNTITSTRKNPKELSAEDKKNGNQLRVLFENDIFTNTDYYFTNGVNIEFTTSLARKGFYKLLPGVTQHPDLQFTGFSITQNIYTPTNPDVENILNNDRPFSAFLTIGQFRETYSFHQNLYMKSRIELGVLGPASLGKTVQSSIHQIEPVGWNNQIGNMPLVNFYFFISKSLAGNSHYEVNLTGDVAAGTAFNRVSPGVSFRTGTFTPLLKGSASIGTTRAWQYWFFVNASSRMVVYDATLQGNIFKSRDPYVIGQDQINRVVAEASAGLAVYKKNVGMEFTLHYISPEFEKGRHFQWGSLFLIIEF